MNTRSRILHVATLPTIDDNSCQLDIHKTVFDRLRQGILVHQDGRILTANKSLCSILDCPAELVSYHRHVDEIAKFELSQSSPTEQRKQALQLMQLRRKTCQNFTTEWKMPSGRIVDVECCFEGGVAVETYADVTEIRDRESLIAAAMATVAQGLLIHDREEILASNPRLGAMLDIPPSLYTPGKRWKDLIKYRSERGDYQDNEKHLEDIYLAFGTGNPLSMESRVGNRTLLTECRVRRDVMFTTYTDVTEARVRERKLRATERKVRKLVEVDGLTDLANRHTLDQELSWRLDAHIKGTGANELAVLLLNLDRFKHLNDNHGLATGDKVLKKLGTRFKKLVRKVDTIARIGGDEFTIVTELDAKSEVVDLANRLLRATRDSVQFNDLELQIDASIGIAFASQELNTTDKLMAAADMALQQAKSEGPGLVQQFNSIKAEQTRKKQSLEQDLMFALEREQLLLHYQVQRDLKTQIDVGYEALMRWEHPIRGLISPAEFIPISEETGMIVEFGRWALNQASCDFESFDESTRIAVNVSPIQFMRSDLVADVQQALDVSGLGPERLEIEITEQLLIEDADKTLTVLKKLRDMGLSIALDDFGSGYSSLAYLTQFPFTKLKIDRCFIDRMLKDKRSSSLVSSILTLASSLGMRVTAEGVEYSEQLTMLVQGECDEVQGYHIGRPLPFDRLAKNS